MSPQALAQRLLRGARRWWRRTMRWIRRRILAKRRGGAAAPPPGRAPRPLDGHAAHSVVWCVARAPAGTLQSAPWAGRSRDFRLWIPERITGSSVVGAEPAPLPLVIWLHGCRQSVEQFATGTGIDRLAQSHRMMVAMPQQKRSANAWGCWNWFDPATTDGGGEAAIVAAVVDAVNDLRAVDRRRVFIAGLSSGAALAMAAVVNHRDLFAAVAVHSGVACGAATTPLRASAVLKQGPDRDVTELPQLSHAVPRESSRRLPALVIHGRQDTVVVPAHARETTRQLLVLDGESMPGAALPAADSRRSFEAGGHFVHESRFSEVMLWEIDGLGHEWSGGDASQPYHSAMGPDAGDAIMSFFAGVAASDTVGFGLHSAMPQSDDADHAR